MLKVIDLFCGMGGLSLGVALGLRCRVAGIDKDRFAVATYNHNLVRLGCVAEVHDLLTWSPRGSYDLVVGGPPCQPFTVSNPRVRGEAHPLFPTLPRFFSLVIDLMPDAFIFENVKGITTRRFRGYLLKELSKVGKHYRVVTGVLNACRYGVPQRRERLIVAGVRRDLRVAPSLPPPTHGPGEWVTLKDAVGDIMRVPPEVVLTRRQVSRIRAEREDTSRHWGRMKFPDDMDAPARTISSHTVGGTKRETIVLPASEHVILPGGGWDNPRSDWGSRVMTLNRPAYTITEKHRSGQVLEGVYRRLTVRECLRIQSFPDWWGFPEGVSTSRKYKLVGEAVPPIMAYRLAVHLGKLMGWDVREPPDPKEWALPYFSKAFKDYMKQPLRI